MDSSSGFLRRRPTLDSVTVTLDEAFLRDLIGFSDDLGVISLYASHSPDQATEQQPAGPIEVRNQLRGMIEGLAARDNQLAKAVRQRVDAAGDEIDWLTHAMATGRGRALFVGVASGSTRSLASQLPFRERAVHHESAYIRPLLAAYDEGRAAGILDVSGDWIRLLSWTAGNVEEIFRRDFEVLDEQVSRQKRGPAPANGRMYGRGNSNREQFGEHLSELDQRFLFGVLAEVAAIAEQRQWDRLVLSGSPKLRKAAADHLAGLSAIDILPADVAFAEESVSQVAAQTWPILRSVREEREQRLVALAVERAMAGNAGALGLRDVCNALNDHRVQHLLYDDRIEPTGFRSEAGTIHHRVEGPVAASDMAMAREPLLIERMVESALATGAAISPIGPDAGDGLRDHEGVAALLRW